MAEIPLLGDLPAWPVADYAAFGPVERRPLNRIQQLTARFLGRNWVAIPHVTHHDEADITELEARRAFWNADHPDRKLTVLPMLVKAMGEALTAHPQFNVSLEPDGKTVVQKAYTHVGVATETPNGLLVPVIRNVESKSVLDLAAEIAAMAAKARYKGLAMAEMSGGSITISSLGHIGGTAFTPIVNAPEAAILGVSKLQIRPTPGPDGDVLWRKHLPLSLSYDHRVINGADAARFVRTLAEVLGRSEWF